MGFLETKILIFELLLLIFAAPAVLAATGNPDELCKAVVDDLKKAEGCVDDDGLEDSVNSSSSLFTLEIFEGWKLWDVLSGLPHFLGLLVFFVIHYFYKKYKG